MLMNNRSPEKNEKNGFGERPKIANEIYELCGILLEQQRAMDGSCPENISGISLNAPPDAYQFSKQKIQSNSSPEKNENLINTYYSNSISFDKQKHTNSPVSLHSEPLIGNPRSDVKISYSSLPSESNTNENGRLQRSKELVRPTVYEPLNDKSSIVPIESNMETIPFIPVSRNQFDTQVRDKLNQFGNRLSSKVSPYNNINMMYDTSSNPSLHSEDIFSTSESPTGIQRTIFSSSKSLAGLNKLFHGNHFYTEKQNTFSINALEFQKDNSLCKTFLRNADKLTKQYEGLKSNPEKVLNSRKTENKLISFNFSLQLENQRRPKDYDMNLTQKKTLRRFSAPSNAGFINKAERNCFLVQTNWHGRKCKSEVQILHETQSMAEIKFLTDSNCKESHFDSNSDILRKSTASEESSKLKRIPTFRGHKLPAKVSVLLLNGPILLNYTENISGKSQEILMCTSDTIEDVIRNENNDQHQDIVKTLFAQSRPYIGKPIHIIFEPRKATETPSLDDFGGRSNVPLHPSPGKYNLLAEEPKDPTTAHYQVNDETDPGRKYFLWENRSDETLVAKQSDQLTRIENRMFNKDSSVLDSSAKQNNRLETSNCNRFKELQAKKKLKIRLCRRKKSRTDLKRVNVKQIVRSVFRNFFHFYSLLGGHLRSGSVITKSNSILWLREAGVATDAQSMELAKELFKDIAGAKVVLNIFDFMQFLIKFARRQQMATVDLIRQLTLCELPRASRRQDRRNSEARRLKTFRQSKHSEQGSSMAKTISIRRSQSLPNLKITPPIFNS